MAVLLADGLPPRSRTNRPTDESTTMTRDIVFITIDCWRHDTVDRMPNLQELLAKYVRSEVVCQASSTRGAFPALFSGQYYPRVYDGFATLQPSIKTLPGVLSSAGYKTAGVCGSNPFLSTWRDYFDFFWNDQMDPPLDGEYDDETLSTVWTNVRHAINFLRLRSRVPAPAVARRGRQWYESTSGPKFLWMHLMDLHVPFLPGWRKGIQEGVLDVYRSHLKFLRDPAAMSDREHQMLERLYWRSVERLDEQIDQVLEFVDDDSLVVLVGDHGEEFDHGKYGHARLYDECIRVPLFMSPALVDSVASVDAPVRQLDLPALLLHAVDESVPTSWEGQPDRIAGSQPIFSLNHSQQFEAVYASGRTDRYKVIKTFDESLNGPTSVEAYDLSQDASEREDIASSSEAFASVEQRLDEFLEDETIREGILERPGERGSAVVESRLKALGYK